MDIAFAGHSLDQRELRESPADWMPDRNRRWFALTVVKVRRKYEMTVDESETEALEEVLSDCQWGIHLHPIPDHHAMKSRLR